MFFFSSAMQYGSSVVATGSIIETSKNTNRFEMVCDAISLLGECDPQVEVIFKIEKKW